MSADNELAAAGEVRARSDIPRFPFCVSGWRLDPSSTGVFVLGGILVDTGDAAH